MSNWIKTNGRTATLTIYDDDGEREVEVPCKFVICMHCQGSGKSSAYLGAFTASDWRELDDEFKEDYMAGRYDRACEFCTDHPGREVVPDLDKLSEEDHDLWDQQCRDEAEYQSLRAMERRMGA